MEADEGIEIFDDRILVSDTEAIVKIKIDAQAGSEIYLAFSGMIYKNYEGTEPGQSILTYTRDNCTKQQTLYSTDHAFYHGRDDYIINMGYIDKTEEIEITLGFSKQGTYILNEMKAVAQPMNQIDEQTNALAEESLENIVIGANKISGTINASTNRLLCISVPYSKGWTAYVDGVETEVKCLNGVYNGIEIVPGEHKILMKYRTPGLWLGLLLGAAGILAYIGVVIYWRKIMRVMYIAPRFHTNQSAVVKGWIKRGDEVTFISYYTAIIEDYSYIKPIVLGFSKWYYPIDWLYVNVIKRHDPGNTAFKINHGFPPILRIRKVMKTQKPDLVIMRDRTLYTIVANLFCRRYGYKAVLYNQSPLWDKPPKQDFIHKLVRKMTPEKG